MQPMTTKLGSLFGIGVVHDLTFSDFGSMASEPVGSKQREHRSVISERHWLFSIIECSFP